MQEQQDVWRAEPNGVLAAELGTYRLLVQAPESPGGLVRFLVLRREPSNDSFALIGSGTETDLR